MRWPGPDSKIAPSEGVSDATLRALAHPDAPASAAFECLARLAAAHYRVPVALVALAAAERVWCDASQDSSWRQSALATALAGPVSERPDGVVVVTDPAGDPRLASHPWVREGPGVRFILSAPVVMAPGHAVGTLTLVDLELREAPDEAELGTLREFAALVADAIVAFSTRRELEAARADAEAARAELARTVVSDPLTGLLNRRAVFDRLDAAIALARRTGHGVAVALLDLDRFRAVNERYGHGVGDGLLLQVSAALEAASRDHDLVARVGGDEFVLLWQALGPEGAAVAAERTWSAVARPYAITAAAAPGTTEVELGASLGVACFPHDAEDAVGLLRAADVAMYAAKRAGGGVVRYDPAS